MLIYVTRDTKLRDFVLMTIQDTQVPVYTKHTLFLYFSIFFSFLESNKINKNAKNK